MRRADPGSPASIVASAKGGGLRFALLSGIVAAAFAASAIASSSGPRDVAPAGFKLVLSGLANPRGLAMDARGAIYLTEAGTGGAGPCAIMRGVQMCYGPTGSVARLWKHKLTVVAKGLPSYAPTGGGGAQGPERLCFDPKGRLFVTYGLGMDPTMRPTLGPGGVHSGYLMRILKGGSTKPVVDISGYEAAHNPAGGPVDSNPYALRCLKRSELATDAGGNDLFRIAKGKLSLLGVFPSRPARSTDSVPDSIAVRGRADYVGELSGKPFSVGAANIYRVRTGQAPETYQTGFTAIIDMRFDRSGNLYVLEHATGPGLSGPGALIKVSPSGARTTVADDLSQPTALMIGHHGVIYVTNNGTTATDGQLLRLIQ
jgi:hypothetical protein